MLEVNLKDVNISRYGSGSSNSRGLCEGMGVSWFCLGFGGATICAVKGRKEHKRLDTGSTCSSSRSAAELLIRFMRELSLG